MSICYNRKHTILISATSANLSHSLTHIFKKLLIPSQQDIHLFLFLLWKITISSHLKKLTQLAYKKKFTRVNSSLAVEQALLTAFTLQKASENQDVHAAYQSETSP